MRVLQLQSRLFRLDSARLDEKNTGDNLQTIGDTVLHFLQQHVLFPQELHYLPLDGAPVGNVLECQKHGGVGSVLVENLAHIQEHGAPPDHRKLSIDLVSLNSRPVLRDRLQKVAKLGDVPLTAVNLVNQMPVDIVAHEPKGLKEGAAGSNHAQILIENHEWIADGIDDGLRKRKSVPDIDEGYGFRRERSEHMNLSPRFLSEGKAALIFQKRWRDR